MNATTKKPATKATKPTKADRVKKRIAKLETTIAKYDANRVKRQDKLAKLKTLLVKLSK
jgi:hypothetical protein